MFKKFYLIFISFISLISTLFSLKTSNLNLDNSINLYPTSYTSISCYFGYRTLFGKQNFHNGIDFLAPQNSKIYATLSGIVTFAGFTNGYGMCVTILHDNGYKSLYGHMSENMIVSTGMSIKQGDIIGYVGPKILSNGISNGWTTGPHLHFTIYDNNGNAIDPLKFEYQEINSN